MTVADPRAPGWPRWVLGTGVAFLLLNALITFETLWPGPWVRPGLRLSFELCLGVLVLMAFVAWRGRAPGPRALATLAAGYTVLVLVRYADVTAPAVFGRDVNLYWDGPHVVEVLRLAAQSWGWLPVAGALLVLALSLGAVWGLSRWAIGQLARSLLWHRPRPWLLAVGLGLSASWTVHPHVPQDTRWFFSLPVSPTLARQAALLPAAWSTQTTETRLSPSPAFDTDVMRLRGAPVLLLFAEAYGATIFDHPQHREALAPAREALADALAASGRHVVSARYRSPTFGGSSWLAHGALLTGVDTHNPRDHDLLLTSRRPHLVEHFARHGYRTVGWMPGLQRPWPEGRYWGYERYADADGVGYTGPHFGYWRIPDQAAMALLHTQELATEGPPRFVVFPTVTSHAPFRPVAPLRDDWTGLLQPTAYRDDELQAALAEPVSWTRPTEAYLQSMRYTLGWLASYLRDHAPDDLLTLVVGDHQPIASVTGPNASWDVPVHIISRDAALLQRFEAAGFTAGLEPSTNSLGPLHALTPLLLSAFDGCGAQAACLSAGLAVEPGEDVAGGRVVR